MSEQTRPVWSRHLIVVPVDVEAIDALGGIFFQGSVEAARQAVQEVLFKDVEDAFDKDGRHRPMWRGQIKIRDPKAE